MGKQNNKSKKHIGESDVFTRRMFIKGIATSFGALPVFAWPRWAQAFYYNLGFFKKGSASSLYVEDVFSTYLYTGNTATQTITNGIDLSNKGGLVWIKGKDSVRNHIFRDSARGLVNGLSSNLTDAQLGWPGMASFNTTGFNLGDDGTPGTNTQSGNLNQTGVKFASWTFRKAAKFFDIVTYTGNGTAPRTLSHSLGIAPGMVVIKRTSGVSNWWVYHRSSLNQGAAYTGIGGNLYLDTTDAADTGANPALSAVSTSSITLSTNQNSVLNISSDTYVAYLFAHDTSTDGLIQCGTFTTDGAAKASVNLGWEAQYVMMKRVDGTGGNWTVLDQTRGWALNNYASLLPNTSGAETNSNGGEDLAPTASGFKVAAITSANASYIFIAIRRPMKTPTDATKVFIPIAYNQAVGTALTVGFPADMAIHNLRTLGNTGWIEDRLRGFASANSAGASKVVDTNSTAAESNWSANNPAFYNFDNTQALLGSNGGGNPSVAYFFRRAPGFFDQICYTGDGVGTTGMSHSLGVVPELKIIKSRSAVGNWVVQTNISGLPKYFLYLNQNVAQQGINFTDGGVDTTSLIYTRSGSNGDASANGVTYLMYLFASCPGVSKVGTYTGNGSSGLNIACGFSSSARFVLIKRTDAVGDWFVWDSARGIIASATEPHLSLNTTANEVTTDDSIDPYSVGFTVKQNTATNINVTAATYIFMAIA